MYAIDGAFGAEPYWTPRFESTLNNRLLYRPAIVDDIVTMVGEALDANGQSARESWSRDRQALASRTR
jgi:hypothetical protein